MKPVHISQLHEIRIKSRLFFEKAMNKFRILGSYLKLIMHYHIEM